LGKAAIAALKSLVAAIAAGGWVAVVVIVIICLIGLIAGSAFGIFFAGEDTRDGNPSLREVIAEINQEHQDEIEQIKADNPHDEVMVSGTKAPWREVLAVYAVKTTTDTANQQDAITLDVHRQQILKDVYWDMNSIESRVEDREYTEIVAVEQPDGSIIEETETYTRRTLYITQSAKTAEQMAVEYSFDAEQRGLLAELLAPEYASAWQSVLYGIRTGSGDIVEVAASQLGNPGGQPYWSWYGFGSRVEWCACFVSWCASESGYIEAGIIPKFSYCQTGISWFADAGCWQDADSGYEPRPGDIIFFDWGDGGDSDHVGIVESCDGATVHTIEGNSGDAVRRSSYNINSAAIVGYGTPEY
jgi:cell wall-associated NlpC family hydrolase